jgi:hypothetical protein
MALTLNELQKKHDTGFVSGQVTRERGADDMVFFYVTQWDDALLSESQLAYRGEFNIVKKAGRDILAGLAENPVQVDFEPKGATREDAAELLDGIYRTDDNLNHSIEAYNQADQEAVVCGMGAWELYTEYVSSRSGDERQVIKRRPIFEANNNAYCDPNAKLLDKSDAEWWSILTAYSEDGYKKYVEELTGEEPPENYADSFKNPEQSYAFPWIGGEGKKIYIVSFYHRAKVKDKILTMVDPFEQVKVLRESDLTEVMDDLIDAGFEVESEKEIERWEVRKYIASGSEILNGEKDPETGERGGEVIPGEYIPVIPEYGEHAWIEGEEHYEGVTRLAKDPQRLRNFQMSYLADITSRSPRPKPIFWPEQIAGFEDMYREAGADSNYPYYLQNRKAGDSGDMPIGPVAQMPEQTIPQALIASIELSREAVSDVANPGLAQDVADPDLSGKAVYALQNRIDKQAVVYQEHRKHSKRYDALVYSSMAAEILDIPQEVSITKPDGTRTTAMVMEQVLDAETGDIVTLNDLTNSEFEVYSTIGASYSTQKEQTIDRLKEMMADLPPGDPNREILMLKVLALMDGVNFDDVRNHANKRLLIMGVKEPETDEEKQMLAELQQQGDEPTAEMVLAMAEMKKGEASEMKNQIDLLKIQLSAKNEDQKRMIDGFKAETDRMDTQIDAQEAGAKIDNTRIDTFGKQLDNQAKIIELRNPQDMTNDELYQQIMEG